ncbi:polysaccharide biosynthesis tyrosine autokinase [Noviherbaspirillum aridicola]|nr:polysaccharide biosynthesis tyrosine autokinase [Noviherbaspirillum aridicola]
MKALAAGAGSMKPTIGRLLMDDGKLTAADVDRILLLQKQKPMRFGEAALLLGVVKDADVQHALARQFDYCFLRPGAGGLAPELATVYRPFSRETERMRSLRARLARTWFAGGRAELAASAVNQGDGVSLLVANLAVCFAQQGARTLLVDANLRRPRQHAIFNLRARHGLADALAGRAGTEAIVELDIVPSLSVLCAGTPPPNPQELLGRPAFDALRARLRPRYDVILYDTPPVSLTDDAFAVAGRAGAVLVVARQHRTSVSDMRALSAHLHAGGIEIAGAVLNDF